MIGERRMRLGKLLREGDRCRLIGQLCCGPVSSVGACMPLSACLQPQRSTMGEHCTRAVSVGYLNSQPMHAGCEIRSEFNLVWNPPIGMFCSGVDWGAVEKDSHVFQAVYGEQRIGWHDTNAKSCPKVGALHAVLPHTEAIRCGRSYPMRAGLRHQQHDPGVGQHPPPKKNS